MRSFLAPLVALALAATADAQSSSLIRIDDLQDGYALAQQFEMQGYDVVEGGTQATSLQLVVSEATLEDLLVEGYHAVVLSVGKPYYEVLREQQEASPDAPPAGYKIYADLVAHMTVLQSTYPALAKLVNVTQAYGAPQTEQGRDIYALKISDNVALDEDEPAVLIVANHHARELNTNVVATEAMDKLLGDYATVPAVKAMVDDNQIWIAPSWNPDGQTYVFTTNTNWRRNRAVHGSCIGVDINRNYAAGWGSSCGGSTGCNDTYKGPSNSSEAETQTMMAFSAVEHFAKVLDFHSFGQETLWGYSGPPSGSLCVTHPWDNFFQNEAKNINFATYGNTSNRNASAQGEEYEWQLRFGAYAYLMEIGNSFQPSFASALAEAQALFGSVQYVLEREVTLYGHTTDACSGAPVDALIEFSGVAPPLSGTWSSGGTYGRFDLIPAPGTYDVTFSAPGYASYVQQVTISAGSPVQIEVGLVPLAPPAVSYCTPGTTASGCTATLSGSGTPSASSASGFDVIASAVEGQKDGLFFFGTTGQQANSWGSGTSFQCVVPPVQRTGLMTGSGTTGLCNGSFDLDFNAWMTANPTKAPAVGSSVNCQLWFRDPQNTSNQSTSLSDGLNFSICP